MKAELYTKDNCTYCDQAKTLLQQKGIEYTEISAVEHLEELVSRVIAASGTRPKSVPQIFLENEYVGGFDKLKLKLV